MALEFHQISHQYAAKNSSWRLTDVSLRVEPGEIVSLFGPSGCGKTSLLRLAAGMESVQEGQITLNGAILADQQQSLAPEKRPIGLVFQDYVLFPHLTVMENIQFGLTHLPKKERETEAQSQIMALRLTGLHHRYPHELSGGQQQRVALARALARNPQALLLDEPFASIGADLRTQLQEEMRQHLKSAQCACLFVTHDPQEALLMGDKIALMDNGHLQEIATAQSLFENPQTLAGAMMFPHMQTLTAKTEKNLLITDFGNFIAPSHLNHHLNQGNVKITVVISEKAIIAHQKNNTENTPLSLIDSRFVGPDWVYYIQNKQTQNTIRATGKAPLKARSPVTLEFDTQQIRFMTKKT